MKYWVYEKAYGEYLVVCSTRTLAITTNSYDAILIADLLNKQENSK